MIRMVTTLEELDVYWTQLQFPRHMQDLCSILLRITGSIREAQMSDHSL